MNAIRTFFLSIFMFLCFVVGLIFKLISSFMDVICEYIALLLKVLVVLTGSLGLILYLFNAIGRGEGVLGIILICLAFVLGTGIVYVCINFLTDLLTAFFEAVFDVISSPIDGIAKGCDKVIDKLVFTLTRSAAGARGGKK